MTRTLGADVAVRRGRIFEYLELTKPRITALVLITTLVGFYMGSAQGLNSLLLLHAIVGTGLVAGGASALNQYLERHHDARMVRTKDRPIPDGRISEGEALLFAVAISLGRRGLPPDSHEHPDRSACGSYAPAVRVSSTPH